MQPIIAAQNFRSSKEKHPAGDSSILQLRRERTRRRGWGIWCSAPPPGSPWTRRTPVVPGDVAVEEIARLVGHASSKVTETVYRHQLRPVMTTGAEKMDVLLGVV
jgi:integrase